MKPRTISKLLRKVIKTFPSVILTGPRQSGKTTLLKSEFEGTYDYASLENPDVRLRAKEDPAGFLGQFSKPVILDEIQYVPELLPYIKSLIDENRKPGKWILTGSQNFALMQNVSESLAGRSAILTLLPFSIAERLGNGEDSISVDKLLSINNFDTKKKLDIAEIILRGNYPEIASNRNVDRQIWNGSYITTYLERDIRNLKQVGDLGQFEIFLRACAIRTGQILDLSSISKEIGVSFTTAKRWLSLLETGYQVYLLYPYYRNIGKRLVKRPKIYFGDTGLASYLMGINSAENLFTSSSFGSLFETMVVIDFLKRHLHHGQMPTMYYLRTQDDLEVDLIIENEEKLNLVEIKSSSTIKKEHIVSLRRVAQNLQGRVERSIVISNTSGQFLVAKEIQNIPVQSILSI